MSRLARTVHALRAVRQQLTERNERLKDEAKAAYEKAAVLVKTMEPEAQEEWVPRVEEKIAMAKYCALPP